MKTKQFDIFYRLLLLTAAFSAASPLSVLLFGGALSGAIYFAPVFLLLGLVLGYILQSVFLPGVYRRSHPSYLASEQRPLRMYAAVPILLAVLLSALTLPLWNRIYYYTVIRSAASWQPGSPYPLLAVLGLFLSILLGILLRFFPPENVASARGFIPACTCSVFLIFLSALAGSEFALLSSVSFAVFLVSIVLLFNQAYISRDYHGSVVSVITPEARLYNMRLVLLMLAAVAGVAALTYVMISGILTLIRMLLFTLLYDILRQNDSIMAEEYYDPELAQTDFYKVVFRESNSTMISFYIAIVILAALVLWLVIRRAGVLIGILNAIRQWLLDLISFWVLAKDMFMPEPVEILNYRDKKTTLGRASVRDYQEMAEQTDRYDAFLRQLRSIGEIEGQLSFAYLVMLRVLREKNVPLRTADTPRECKNKIHRADAADVREITDAIEHIKYAGEAPEGRGNETLREICLIVKKYLG